MDRETLKASQTSLAPFDLYFNNIAVASLIFSSMTRLLPPVLPLTLAASNPAIVLSRITSLSNSAMEAKTWKISLPPGVVLSSDSLRLLFCDWVVLPVPNFSRSEP